MPEKASTEEPQQSSLAAPDDTAVSSPVEPLQGYSLPTAYQDKARDAVSPVYQRSSRSLVTQGVSLGLEIGVASAAAVLGTALLPPFGGMLASAAVSGLFSLLSSRCDDGSINWGRVAFSTALGLLPGLGKLGLSKMAGVVANKVSQTFWKSGLGRLASRLWNAVPPPAQVSLPGAIIETPVSKKVAMFVGNTILTSIKGAIFGASYGYSKSVGLGAYDNLATGQSLNWTQLHANGLLSAADGVSSGMIGAGLASPLVAGMGVAPAGVLGESIFSLSGRGLVGTARAGCSATGSVLQFSGRQGGRAIASAWQNRAVVGDVAGRFSQALRPHLASALSSCRTGLSTAWQTHPRWVIGSGVSAAGAIGVGSLYAANR